MVSRGALIVFEGIDRSGKSTQTKKMLEYFEKLGLSCELLRFPDRVNTKTGPLISNYLKSSVDLDDRVIHLLFSANRWECSKNIEEKLNKGVNLIVDRYAFSGVAYTASKPGMDLEWCKQPDRGLPKPDIVIFLDMDVDKAATRGSYGEERYEKIGFQRKVQSNFRQLLDTSYWKVINADQDVEQVFKQISDECSAIVARVREENLPLKKLWI